MNIVKSTSTPHTSLIHQKFQKIDFADAFYFHLPNPSLPIEKIYLEIFSTSPRWVSWLMRIRNKLVTMAGLKTETKSWRVKNLVKGEKVGFFKIYDIGDKEIIAGEDDKHLNFRVSVLKDQERVVVSTFVKYNNRFGRLYMAAVRPFHKIIVKSMLKRAALGMRDRKNVEIKLA